MENIKNELPSHIKNLSSLAVRELQQLLNRHGYGLEVDGIVGKNTLNAFNYFKEKHGLTHPNEIGRLTLDYLLKSPQFIKPAEGRISSPYGWRTHPISGKKRFHAGIDIANNYGTPIIASHSGTVIFSGTLGGYGYTIKVQDGNIISLYAHCNALIAKQGQKVKQGELIARMGSTGYSTGSHLHFEIHVNGKHTNPMQIIH
jgi:murein DD-endopeptidase MepM/ murein hydrolase activator NlpD